MLSPFKRIKILTLSQLIYIACSFKKQFILIKITNRKFKEIIKLDTQEHTISLPAMKKLNIGNK